MENNNMSLDVSEVRDWEYSDGGYPVTDADFAIQYAWYFHTDKEFLQMFDDLISSFPTKMSKESIGTATDGTIMWMYKIGNLDTDAKVLVDGQLHGSEDMGSMLCFWLAEWLVHEVDGDATAMLNNNGIYLVPIVNINSLEWNIHIDHRPNNDTSDGCAYGTDLNRNFAEGWSDGGDCNSNKEGSWHGNGPASSDEAKVMQTLMTNLAPKVYINLHGGQNWSYYNAIGNVALAQSIRTRTSSLRSERSAPNFSGYYLPGTTGTGSGGWAIRYANTGANIPCSWLIEVYGLWAGLDANKVELQTYRFPNFLCHVIGAAEVTYENYGTEADPPMDWGTDGWWSGWWT